MSCSIPFFDKWLHKLGYEPACILHDIDYSEATSYRHKLQSDLNMYKNMQVIKEWYSIPIGILSVFILSSNPFSYYLYFKNKHNLAGHFMTSLWLGLTGYSLWSLYV